MKWVLEGLSRNDEIIRPTKRCFEVDGVDSFCHVLDVRSCG